MKNNDLITLANRSLVKVSGNDYENFLQSIITIDLNGKDRELLSSCFLSPQGKLLNQFFVITEKYEKALPLPSVNLCIFSTRNATTSALTSSYGTSKYENLNV